MLVRNRATAAAAATGAAAAAAVLLFASHHMIIIVYSCRHFGVRPCTHIFTQFIHFLSFHHFCSQGLPPSRQWPGVCARKLRARDVHHLTRCFRQPFSNLFPHLTMVSMCLCVLYSMIRTGSISTTRLTTPASHQVGDDGWSKGIEGAVAMSGGMGEGWVDGTTCYFGREGNN